MSLKNPNWNDAEDRALYDKLFYCRGNKALTEDEKEFCTFMYHFEEYICGLDGDRQE